METKPVTAIVECPQGSAYKYDYEPKSNRFKLSKLLPAGMVFPFDFGFIPGTKGEDGDPLDIIVLSELKTFVGCSIDCRIIGAITAKQTERNGMTVENDRYLGIPVVSGQFKGVASITDLPSETVDQLEQFFINYNAQAGKNFEPTGRLNANDAKSLLSRFLLQ